MSERIIRAYGSNIREHKKDLQLYHEVYYKRNVQKDWKGLTKITGIDGKNIVKQNGSVKKW